MAGYAILFAINFASDPLGQAPVLDGRENIAWAELIAADRLPEEPFYRALLYPLVLSLVADGLVPAFATLFGICMHGLSALLVGLIAQKLWRNPSAGYFAGVLYLGYPVALYFSGQVLDITFSTTLFLASLYALIRVPDSSSKRAAITFSLLAGLLGGAAVLARPNFLPAVICFPFVSLLFFGKGRLLTSALTAAALAMILGLQGLANWQVSGEFRLLPWQGSYNLYAANRDGANGKYYTQQVAFDQIPAGKNTTRMESEWLYREAQGPTAPLEVHEMSQHWRGRLLEEIGDDPQRWLGLMFRKSIYTLNNWEQYNNLTYAYHKARWPMLTWNPLGWGVLLILAAGGIYIGFKDAKRDQLYAIAVIGCAYAAGLLLFFVSARFRLPLTPLLCVAAGGWAYFTQFVTTKRCAILGGGALLLSVVSFGNWFQAKDETTYIQDEILLAKASSEVGQDLEALKLAQDIMLRDPDRQEAHRLALTSLFNLWLGTDQVAYWHQMGAALESIESADASVEFIRGVYHWRELDPDRAIETWRLAVERFGQSAQSSSDALQAVGGAKADPARAAAQEAIRSVLQR